MDSELAKAVIYKFAVDVPMLMLVAWLWFGHPARNLWFVGITTTVGTILLFLFEKYWAIQDRWRHALPVALTWLVMVTAMFAYAFIQTKE